MLFLRRISSVLRRDSKRAAVLSALLSNKKEGDKLVRRRQETEEKTTLASKVELVFHISLWILALIGAINLGIIAIVYLVVMFWFFARKNDEGQ